MCWESFDGPKNWVSASCSDQSELMAMPAVTYSEVSLRHMLDGMVYQSLVQLPVDSRNGTDNAAAAGSEGR